MVGFSIEDFSLEKVSGVVTIAHFSSKDGSYLVLI